MDLHSKIKLRMYGKRYDTTVGRVLLWEIIPKVDIAEMRHISVAAEEDARQILDRLSAGEAFVDLVRECSQAADKDNDGLLGKLTFNEFKSIFGCR